MPLKCTVSSIKFRVLLWCICHFQSSSPFFILASSVCKSLQCLISALTQGGEGGHLFRFICSVVLWGGSNTANKYCWHVWGVLTVGGPHWVCHSPRQHVLPRFTLLRFPGCSARALPQVGPVSHAVSRTKPLRFLGVL